MRVMGYRFRDLQRRGLTRTKIESLGGQISDRGGNVSFAEDSPGFTEIAELTKTPIPAPVVPRQSWLQTLPDDERAVVTEIDKQPEGLGDSLTKMIEALGLDRAAKLYEKITGKSCGCEKRKAWLNKFWKWKK